MRHLIRSLAAEAVGTFGFVFLGGSAVVYDAATNGGLGPLGVALAQGLALGVLVSAVMNISGGHLNPAVSIGLLVGGKLAARTTVLYVLVQLTAAVLAATCIRWLLPAVPAESVGFGALRLAPSVTLAEGIALEALLTFFLMTVVLGTAVSAEAPKLGGFAIGLVVAADILAGGGVTGAAMNPARAFGPAVVAGFWRAHAVYWIGPILGAVAAGLLWRLVLLPAQRPS